MKNFYDILKIGRNANQTEIKKAYLNELKKETVSEIAKKLTE